MARPLRIEYSGVVYHITSQGVGNYGYTHAGGGRLSRPAFYVRKPDHESHESEEQNA
jgi:hypothetical protein